MSQIGSAYLAASFLTTQHVDEVANDYLTWMNAQAVPATAEDALLAAAQCSKSPERVLAQAALYYDEFDVTVQITTVAPDTGLAAGGTALVITGLNLTGSTGVTFGGVDGTAFSVVDDQHIHVTTPAHAAGAVDVVVANPNGNHTATAGYTYA